MNTTPALQAVAPLAPVTRRRVATVFLWAGQLLFAALFIFGGINKLFGLQEEMVRNFANMGVGVWFRDLVGVLELTGGALLLSARFSGLGAMLLTAVMVGAVFTHLYIQPPAFVAVFPAIIGGLLLLIARGRRPETQQILERARW